MLQSLATTIEWRLRVRVIKLWKLPEHNRPQQIKSIKMILLDKKIIKISIQLFFVIKIIVDDTVKSFSKKVVSYTLLTKTIYFYNILKKDYIYIFLLFKLGVIGSMHFVEWSCWRDERIQASIRPHVFSDFESIIEEDDAYLMEKLVVDLDRKFKPTKHKYALSFVWVTKVTKLLDTNSIPKVYFDFVTFADIL